MIAYLRRLAEWQEQVFDPPDFQSLAAAPELRAAAVATFQDGLAWFSASEANNGTHNQRPTFAWQMVHDAAESAARESGKQLREMDAMVLLLNIEGLWTYLAGPGIALRGVAVSANPAAAGTLLRDTFMSRFY